MNQLGTPSTLFNYLLGTLQSIQYINLQQSDYIAPPDTLFFFKKHFTIFVKCMYFKFCILFLFFKGLLVATIFCFFNGEVSTLRVFKHIISVASLQRAAATQSHVQLMEHFDILGSICKFPFLSRVRWDYIGTTLMSVSNQLSSVQR